MKETGAYTAYKYNNGSALRQLTVLNLHVTQCRVCAVPGVCAKERALYAAWQIQERAMADLRTKLAAEYNDRSARA